MLEEKKTVEHVDRDVIQTIAHLNLDNKSCNRCNELVNPADKILQYGGEFFHEDCFVCAQCFQATRFHRFLRGPFRESFEGKWEKD